ncbi:hypothetical protein C8R46DRAFT_1125592 [Mycena filopes]|nr:hypothetical protein C8R46DRAFT_1125592 [Mycena filopes]
MLDHLAADRTRVAELEAQILHLEQSLHALQDEQPLRSLKDERDLAQQRLDSYHYPVLDLPLEITCEIFLQFLPVYPVSPPLIGLESPHSNLPSLANDSPQHPNSLEGHGIHGRDVDGATNTNIRSLAEPIWFVSAFGRHYGSLCRRKRVACPCTRPPTCPTFGRSVLAHASRSDAHSASSPSQAAPTILVTLRF